MKQARDALFRMIQAECNRATNDSEENDATNAERIARQYNIPVEAVLRWIHVHRRYEKLNEQFESMRAA
jgi:hypothetical protein